MCLLYMSDLWPLIEQTTSNHYPTSLCSAHHFAAAWMPRATAKDLQSCIHFVAGSSKKPWSRISENQHLVSFASTQYFIVVFCWFYMVLFAAGLEDLAGSEKQKKTHASGERLQASVAPLWSSNTSFLPDRQIPKISRWDKIRRCSEMLLNSQYELFKLICSSFIDRQCGNNLCNSSQLHHRPRHWLCQEGIAINQSLSSLSRVIQASNSQFPFGLLLPCFLRSNFLWDKDLRSSVCHENPLVFRISRSLPHCLATVWRPGLVRKLWHSASLPRV